MSSYRSKKTDLTQSWINLSKSQFKILFTIITFPSLLRLTLALSSLLSSLKVSELILGRIPLGISISLGFVPMFSVGTSRIMSLVESSEMILVGVKMYRDIISTKIGSNL